MLWKIKLFFKVIWYEAASWMLKMRIKAAWVKMGALQEELDRVKSEAKL